MIWTRCCNQSAIRLISDLTKCSVTGGRSKCYSVYKHKAKLLVKETVAVYSVTYNQRMASGTSGAKNQNKLALERSPYLLQHASNPVDWYPWGQEALDIARRENKLIFLSVGYSTCHWCHVMEKESFENAEIAQIMNKYYVNIKVDREERPDIDRVYMTFVQSISGHGGWPMSVFLTPDLTPITGGTYFPPEDKYGQPGFKKVLLTIADKWHNSQSNILTSSTKIIDALRHSIEGGKDVSENTVPAITCAKSCVSQLSSRFEEKFGGFSMAPKFPQPVNLNLLFLMHAREPMEESGKHCLHMCIHTLTKMANGGIHDHVGQGFARYSVDEKWQVPHFEKMLYDQGQLLKSYSEAYLATKDTFFADIANDIVTYVTRDLSHSEGGFYSAEDADSYPYHECNEKREGAFYVWKHSDIECLLEKKISEKDLLLSDIFCYHFNVKSEGNIQRYQDPHGELENQNVLIVFGSLTKTSEHFDLPEEKVKEYLKECLSILFKERIKRPRPHLDNKFVTAWNGLMITGLSHAASALDNKKYTEFAEKAAKFVEKYLYDKDNKVLYRSCYCGNDGEILQTSVPIKGFQVDYAFLIQGLLDLYEASFNSYWIEWAETLQNTQDRLFWDERNGGYFSTTLEDQSVILRLKDDQDGAEPSGNSVACRNLLRLGYYLECSDYNKKAALLLGSMKELLEEYPIACPDLVTALVNYHDSLSQVFIVFKNDSEETKKMVRAVTDHLIPGRLIVVINENDSENILFRKNSIVAKMKTKNGMPTAYVCRHRICSLPITDPAQLMSLLTSTEN